MESQVAFATVFSAQHQAWPSSDYAWDPSRLVAATSHDGKGPSTSSEGPGNSRDADRDQSLGPVPMGWKQAGRHAASAAEGSKAVHPRIPKALVCQVEGCNHDLSLEKGYYQRYRICEPHVKLLTVEVEGKACRFCQQCGRFHELSEFDGNKRSCRARLLLHNARRRKRDPLDAPMREQPTHRKSKPAHPRSDSSNDNELDSRGSFSVSHGPGPSWPASAAPGSISKQALTSGGGGGGGGGAVASLATRAGLSDQGMPLPGYPHQPSTRFQAQLMHQQHQQEQLLQELQQEQLQQQLQQGYGQQGYSLQGYSLQGYSQQGYSQQQQQVVDFARAFSDDADVPIVDALKLDDDFMLDGVLGVDYMSDPRMALPDSAAAAGLMARTASPGSLYGGGMGGGMGIGMGGGMGGGMQGRLGGMQQQDQQMAQHFQNQNMACNMAGGMGGGMGGGGQVGYSGMHGGFCMGPQVAVALPEQPMSMQVDMKLSPSDMAAALSQHSNQQRQLQQIAATQQRLMQSAGMVPAGAGAGAGALSPAAAGYESPSSMPLEAGPNSGMSVSSMSSAATHRAMSASMPGGGGPRASNGIMLSGGVTLNMSSTNGMAAPVAIATSAAPASAIPGVGAGGTSTFDLARRLAAGGGAAALYRSDDFMVRVSIKLANCTPEELPPDLYQRLQHLLSTADASLIQGFLRPGCTHLVVDVRSGSPALPLAASKVRASLGSAARRFGTLVQLGDEVAMWAAGAPSGAAPVSNARVSALEAAGALPVISHVSASASVCGGGGDGAATVVVYGTGLARAGVQLFARMQGGYLPVTVQPLVEAGAVPSAAAADASLAAAAAMAQRCQAALARAGRAAPDALLVSVTSVPGSGLLLLEAQAGPLLSGWRPCLLAADAAVAAELSALGGRALVAGAAALASLEAFTTDLGRVLDSRSSSLHPAAAAAAPSGRPRASSTGSSSSSQTAPVADELDEEEEEEEDDIPSAPLEVVCACEQMLAWSTDAGLAAVSTFLVAALLQYGQELQAVLQAPYADGLTVVHRCMRSGSAATVRALLGWVEVGGVQLAWGGSTAAAAAAAAGFSPLHLAAVRPASWEALASVPAVKEAWVTERASDGATPVQLQRMLLASLPPGVARQLGTAFASRRTSLCAYGPADRSLAAAAQQVEQQRQQQQQQLVTPTSPSAIATVRTAAQAVKAAAESGTQQQFSRASSSTDVAPPTTATTTTTTTIAPTTATAPRASILRTTLPFIAILAVFTAIGLLPIVHAPYLPALAFTAVLTYTVHSLYSLAAAPDHGALLDRLALVLLPTFRSAALEAAFRGRNAASQTQLDNIGVSALLLLCCAAAHVSGGGHANNVLASVNVSLTLLPLLLQQLSKPLYARARSLVLVAPYAALLNVTCVFTQHLLAASQQCCSVMLYSAMVGLACVVAPIDTAGMLMCVAYSVSGCVRAWTRQEGLLGGAASVSAAEACGAAQLAVVSVAAAFMHVRELGDRQRWVAAARAAAELK